MAGEQIKDIDVEKMGQGAIDACRPHANSQLLTVEKLKKMMPKGSSFKITEETLGFINNAHKDGIDQDLFEEQLISYTHLLGPGINLEKLMNAIKFVTLISLPRMGQAKAYSIVFPAKAAEVEARGQIVASFASMYANTKAVNEVQKLQVFGAHITHRPLFNQGIQKLVDLSNGIGAGADDFVSPTVQMNSTIAYMDIIKPPEESTLNVNMGMTDADKTITQGLTEQLAAMADIQMKRLAGGEDIGTVQKLGLNAESLIINAKAE